MQNVQTVTFESGASTQQANNLVLSVLSDGDVYKVRIDAAKRIIAGHEPMRSFRDIVADEACKQRRQGSRFRPEHISEAAKIVLEDTINDVLQDYVDGYTGETINVVIRRWFDKVKGNSYFSCKVFIPTNCRTEILVIPFQYGNGSHPEWETVQTLCRIGFFTFDRTKYTTAYPLSFDDQGYMKKNQQWKRESIKFNNEWI